MKKIAVLFLILLALLAACEGKDKNDLYREGLAYRDDGNNLGSIVLFKNALDQDPNFFDARLALAQTYFALDRLEVAEKEFQKVLLQDPDNLDALIGLYEIQLRTDRSGMSLQQLQADLLKNPDEPRLLNLLGEAYASQERFQDAEKILDRVLKLDANNERAILNLARLKILRKEYPSAHELLSHFLEANRENPAPRILLARLYSLKGDREAALAQYLEVFRIDPANGGALYRAGLLALDLNDLTTAETVLKQLTQHFSEYPATARLEGLILFRRNEFEQAAVALQRSLTGQNDLLSLYFLGLSQYQIGQFEQAISQFQRGLDLAPEQVPLRVSLAQTLLKKDRVDDCIAELQKALHYDRNSALAHNVLGSAYLVKGDYEKAMEMLDRAAELDPQIADVHLKKGIFNLKQGDMRLGELELEKAVNLSPEVLNTRIILATHYLQQQNYTDAITLLNEGLKGGPEDALLYNYLAGAYFGQKNAAQAVESLREAIRLVPDFLTPSMNLAAYFLNEGEYDQAIGVYRAALEYQPENVRILLSLASVLEFRGEATGAEELFRRAAATGDVAGISSLVRYRLLKKDPEGALAILEGHQETVNSEPALLELKVAVQLALAREKSAYETLLQWSRIAPESGASALSGYYLKQGNQDAAISLADNLIVERANSGLGYWLKAKIQMQLGKLEEAQRSINDGLNREPQSLQLRFLQANLYRRMEDVVKAEAALSRLIADQPDYYPAVFALGVLKDSSGNKSQARQLYEKTLKINRQHIPALNNLAYMLTENYNDPKGALELAVKAYRQMPSSPEIIETLGFVLVKNGRYEDAVPLLEKAYEVFPDNPAVQLHLGMAYQGIGKNESARDLLKKVLVAGNHDAAREARRMLPASN